MKATTKTLPPALPPDGRGGSIPIFQPDTVATQTIVINDTNVWTSKVFSSTNDKLVRIVATGAIVFIGVGAETKLTTPTASMPMLEDSVIEVIVPAGEIITAKGDGATVYLIPSLN